MLGCCEGSCLPLTTVKKKRRRLFSLCLVCLCGVHSKNQICINRSKLCSICFCICTVLRQCVCLSVGSWKPSFFSAVLLHTLGRWTSTWNKGGVIECAEGGGSCSNLITCSVHQRACVHACVQGSWADKMTSVCSRSCSSSSSVLLFETWVQLDLRDWQPRPRAWQIHVICTHFLPVIQNTNNTQGCVFEIWRIYMGLILHQYSARKILLRFNGGPLKYINTSPRLVAKLAVLQKNFKGNPWKTDWWLGRRSEAPKTRSIRRRLPSSVVIRQGVLVLL